MEHASLSEAVKLRLKFNLILRLIDCYFVWNAVGGNLVNCVKARGPVARVYLHAHPVFSIHFFSKHLVTRWFIWFAGREPVTARISFLLFRSVVLNAVKITFIYKIDCYSKLILFYFYWRTCSLCCGCCRCNVVNFFLYGTLEIHILWSSLFK